MKALILILLAAVYAAAQNPTPTVADIARQERARRAQGKSSKVYTTEDIRTTPAPSSETDPAANPDASAVPGTPDGASLTPAPAPNAPGPTPAPAPAPPVVSTPPATPAQDPVQQWMLENEKIRQQLRDLMDQEANAQLEINAATNQLNAPVSSQSAKDQAAASLKGAQEKLTGIRDRISKGRSELQTRESLGPPKR